ncbi:glycoside hydrolase family 97 protein [Candidatus Saccharibacteria bacterium]|nr:glycoside hydrolase family 97 protein [Candidatus Saccharibacteria bacterium]
MKWLGNKFSQKTQTGEYSHEVFSPSGRVRFMLGVRDGGVFYSLKRDEKVIVRESKLGLDFVGEESFGRKFKLLAVKGQEVNSKWETVFGEEKVVVNKYHEGEFRLGCLEDERGVIVVRVRVFDDGIGFRYEIAERGVEQLTVKEELTEFNVDQNGRAWWIPAYQPDRYEYLYQRSQVVAMDKPVHTPLTIKTTSGAYVSIHEAALYDYGAMVVRRHGDTLRAEVTPMANGDAAQIELPFNTPWRVVMVASRAMDLAVNRIMLNLNEPAREDFAWVKPMKYLGIWWSLHIGEQTWHAGDRHGATTENTMEYIDYAAKLGIRAVLIEGWNEGWEGDWLECGKDNKFTLAYPDFNMKKVADYAKEKGVEIVGHHETVGFIENYESQWPEAFEFYKDHGVKYIKLGYAGTRMLIDGTREFHHCQPGVRHYQRVAEIAAKYGMMLNIHEPIKGTGIERTWPNIMTREGARGQEYEGGGMTPEHHTIIPFTRGLAGGFDYTPGIFDIHSNGVKTVWSTLARQLALFVTIYSSWQMAADRPRFYEGNPAFKFVQDVPADWQKTVPLVGEIGECWVVARQDRESDDWYVGGVTNEDARAVSVYFEFLDEGCEYEAEIYRDGCEQEAEGVTWVGAEGRAHFRENPLAVVIEKRRVKKGDRLEVWMAEGGGFAVRVKRVE